MTARYRCETCGIYNLDKEAKLIHFLGNPLHWIRKELVRKDDS